MNSFPEFYGKDKTRVQCEAIALARIDPTVREREADLMGTKWFDYRLWHWVTATYYYAHCYSLAAREFCRQNNDLDRAELLKPFGIEDVLGTRDATSLVRARQALDEIGVRYEWALTYMVRRFSDRGWHAFPRPNQIYSEELIWDIRDAWNDFCKQSLQLASSDQLKAHSRTHVAGEYRAWLMKQVRARGSVVERPLSRLLSEQMLTDEDVVAEFGPEALRAAHKILGR